MLPWLDSSMLGRHLLAAEGADTARALLGLQAVDLPDDGSTDVAPAVQRAYDQGAAGVQLVSGRTYLWNSAVFLDRDDVLGGFVIEGNGARVVLGTGLPGSDWSRDRTTGFAVFPNTRRGALTGGSVAVTPANRATGPRVGAVRPLTVRNLVVDGGTRNVGFTYANRSGVTFDQVVLWRARVGATWADYSDGNLFLGCYSRTGGGPAAQVLVEQVAPGDGLVVQGGKADSPVDLLRLRGCRGGVVQGVVTGRMTFEECDGVVVTGAHLEGQESDRPMVTVRNSRVTLQGCALYQTYDEAVGSVVVDDSASDATSSDLTLTECTVVQLVAPKHPDAAFSPFLRFGTVRAGTRVTARGLQGRQASMLSPGRWRDTAQPAIAAPGSKALRNALASRVGRALLASGDFQLRRSATAWRVLPAGGGPVVSHRQSTPPAIPAAAGPSGAAIGTLPGGARYTYTAAVLDARGRYSGRTSVRSTAVGSAGAIDLQVALADAPGSVVIWRGTGAAPDRWAVVPARAAVVHLLDSGTRIGGVPWRTAKVPDPTEVAARNRTAAGLLVDGVWRKA